ncbi:MAG: prohibitin family protein [Myxococcota bacterium]
MPPPKSIQLAAAGVAALCLTVLSFASCSRVEEGKRGVELTFGAAASEPLDPGLHVTFPFAQRIEQVDIRQHVFEQQTNASSADEQNVATTVALNYRLKPDSAVAVYATLGREPKTWESTVFAPQIKVALKSVTARYKARELIVERAKVKAEITDLLEARISGEHFEVLQVSITDFTFSAKYMAAIEAKQVAEQAAQQAQNELERNRLDVKKLEQQATSEAAATLTRAKADAEAMRIRASADAEYHQAVSDAASELSLRHIELERWNGVSPLYVGEGSLMLPAAG